MLFKLNFVLFWHVINGSAASLLPLEYDSKFELSTATIEFVLGICNRPTVNFIHINHSDIGDEMIKIASERFTTVRVESIEYLNYTTNTAKKNCNIFVITSVNDFIKIQSIINPHLFHYLKHFLIVSLELLPPSQIEQIFQLLWKKFILNANLFQLDESRQVTVTTFYPFKAHACNDTKPTVVNYYKNGKFLNAVKSVDKLSDLQECPMKIVTAVRSEPFIIIKKHKDKVHLMGRDVKLIEELSKLLNFRTEYIILEDKGFITENGTSKGLFKFLANGSADLVINDLWLTSTRNKFFDTTTPYATDELFFVIPLMAELSPLQKFIHPFAVSTWIALITCILIGFVVIIITKFQSKNVQNFIFGRKVRNQFLNVWIALMGTTQRSLPGRNFARYILMNFLLFSLVIRTAYQGSMFKVLKNVIKQKEPQTINDLLKLNYNFYVHEINMDLFKQFESLQKSIIVVNSRKREEGLNSTHDPSFKNAIAISKNMFIYRNQKNVGKTELQLRICKERLLSIPVVIYAPKNSIFINALNEKIIRIVSAGLIDFWLSQDIDEKFKNYEENSAPKALNLNHLSGCFYMMIIGYVIALCVLVGEMIKNRLEAKKKQKILWVP